MKPTAEMVERARAIVRKRREQPVGVSVTWPDAIAQALADEHERAMHQPAIREAEIRGATWALEYAESAPPSKLMPGAQRNYEAEAARIVDAKRDKG